MDHITYYRLKLTEKHEKIRLDLKELLITDIIRCKSLECSGIMKATKINKLKKKKEIKYQCTRCLKEEKVKY